MVTDTHSGPNLLQSIYFLRDDLFKELGGRMTQHFFRHFNYTHLLLGSLCTRDLKGNKEKLTYLNGCH